MIPYYDYQFRVIVIGDSMVGKSSFLRCFVEGKFTSVCDPTVGVDFYSRTVRIRTDTHIKLQLWDTAGQEKFRSIAKSYYRNCVGVFILFDLTDRETYEHVASWYEEAIRSIRCSTPVIVLVGSKSDRQTERKVSKLEAESLAQRLGNLTYLETSSVNGQNVEHCFEGLAETVYDNLMLGTYKELSSTGDWDGIKVSQNAALAATIARQSLHMQPPFADSETSHGCC